MSEKSMTAWILEIRKENPHLTDENIEWAATREELRREANKWAGQVHKYLIYANREYRFEIFKSAALSMSESFLALKKNIMSLIIKVEKAYEKKKKEK